MTTIKRFENIEAWKKAGELCAAIGKYIEEERFRKNYRLIDQVEGTSGPVMDNIAEKFERSSKKEFILLLGYAKEYAGEFRSQLHRLLKTNIAGTWKNIKH